MTNKVIKERVIGHKTVLNTDWPIKEQLVRVSKMVFAKNTMKPRIKVQWEIVRGLCNGVPNSVEIYKTLKEALDNYGE